MSDPTASPDDLQFHKAEYETAEPKLCRACNQPMRDSFYQLGAAEVCESCANAWSEQEKRGGIFLFLRGALFGLGGAFVGWLIYYAVALMGVEIGIVAIAVGWLVGKAIRMGARGKGGRAYQIMALLLTYVAISETYAPLVYKASMNGVEESAQRKSAPLREGRLATTIRVFFVISIGVFCLAMPFLILAQSPASGLLSLLILFFGLQQAWRLTARYQLTLAGPFPVTA